MNSRSTKEPKLRNELVRDTLHQLLFARPHGGKLNFQLTTELPFNCVELSLDPANITLEPEYYGDIDEQKYAERKPLIYLWQMFDRSPLALNHWLGFRLRCVLGSHIFKSLGKNVKMFHGIEFSFGYNLTIEDNCTIHKYVMLDDRGEIIVRNGTSISDYASVYSHAHHPINSQDIDNRRVEVGTSGAGHVSRVSNGGCERGRGRDPRRDGCRDARYARARSAAACRRKRSRRRVMCTAKDRESDGDK